MYALVLLCINQHTKFEMPSFINSKGMIGETAKFKMSRPLARQLGGSLSSEC